MICTICESPLVYPHVIEIAGQIEECCDSCYERISEDADIHEEKAA